MAKKRGRPVLFNRKRIRAIIRDARGQNVSLRQYCADNGLVYITMILVKKRYGIRTGRTRKVLKTA